MHFRTFQKRALNCAGAPSKQVHYEHLAASHSCSSVSPQTSIKLDQDSGVAFAVVKQFRPMTSTS